jgi:hypothetical protein
MKRSIYVALGTCSAVAAFAAMSLGTAASPATQTIGQMEYRAAIAGIDAAREKLLARCDEGAAAMKEICRAEAAADELVRVADLESRYRQSHGSARGAQRARIEARYQVDRAKCATLGGLKRDQCFISAHAARGRAMLEAAAPYETRS